MRDGLRKPHPLPHALGIARDLAIRRLRQTQTLERLPRSLLCFRSAVAEKKEAGGDKREPGRPPRRGVVLGGVARLPHQCFGIARRDPAHQDAAVVGEDQAGHQIHQRRLARPVRSDEARDSWRDVQRDAVYAEHLAVKLRDVFENDRGATPLGLPCTLSREPLRRLAPFAWLTRCARSNCPCHRTTSTGRNLRSITSTSTRTNTDSDTIDAAAPGPSGRSTPRSVRHTWFTAQAGSRMWPHVTRNTLSIIVDTPARMKKMARLTAPATILHFTYADAAIATRPRTSSHRRNPMTTAAPSVQFARNHHPPARPTCSPNKMRPGIHVTTESMPTMTVSRARA